MVEHYAFGGDDALRPDETVAERLDWAMDWSLHGDDTDLWTFDAGPLAYRTRIESVDYRGQTIGSVIEDCLRALKAASRG